MEQDQNRPLNGERTDPDSSKSGPQLLRLASSEPDPDPSKPKLVLIQVEGIVAAPSAVDVDLSTTEPEPTAPTVEPKLVNYDPARDREHMRGVIALALLVVLSLLPLGVFLLLSWGKVTPAEAKDLLTVLFPPLVSLVAAATAFYYASQH